MEDYPIKPTASAFSNQSPKLSLWADQDPFSDLHALGGNWASSRLVSVFLPRDAGPTRPQLGSREKPSAHDRVLGLAWRFWERSSNTYIPRPYCFEINKARSRRR